MRARLRSWWKKRSNLLVVVIGIIALLAIIGFIIAAYRFPWNWAGFFGKTFWDWLGLLASLAVPFVVGFGVAWFTRTQQERDQEAAILQHGRDQQLASDRAKSEQAAIDQRAQIDRDIAQDNQREIAFQTYLDRMSELLLEKKLWNTKPEDEIRKVARVRTLRVLPRLDNERKRNVIQFLHESGLINKDNPIISLNEADLRKASLDEAQLQGANLSGAKLMGANLSKANLEGANLHGAKYNTKTIQSKDAQGNPLTFEPTQWPQGFDFESAGLKCVDG